MSNINIELLNLFIKAGAIIILAFITNYIVPFIETKIGKDKLKTIIEYSAILVNGVEQKMFGEEKKGKEKLDEVTNLLSQKATELGLSLSDEDIRLIIENSVKSMKEAKSIIDKP